MMNVSPTTPKDNTRKGEKESEGHWVILEESGGGGGGGQRRGNVVGDMK